MIPEVAAAARRAEFTFARRVGAVAIIGLAVAYTAGVLTGVIAQENRIDLPHLALIGVAGLAVLLVATPGLPSRVRTLKLGALELEMLERVGQQVRETSIEVEDLKLIFPLLLPEPEQQHLVNLRTGTTTSYVGSHDLRYELRRLRYLRLVVMKRGYIADLHDGQVFDLADHVQLTELGVRLVDRIQGMRAERPPGGG